MWTPKRILLLVAGFVFFFLCFQVYHFFLGRYDGLAPLPLELRPGVAASSLPPLQVLPDTSYLADVKEAFGEKCEEINRRVFEWKQQGLLIATEQWKILPSGRLLFTKVSVALFPQGQRPGTAREINTLRGDEAEIEFDKPVKNLGEIAQRKPIAGELRGNVLLKNNRKTTTPDDDVRLLTSWLKYRDDQHRIWTDAPVRMADDGCGAMVTAVGLEVELVAVPPDGKSGGGKNNPTISGVKRARLDHDIRMELPDDGQSNFLAGGKRPPDAAAAQLRPPVKSLVVIEAQGPFLYQVDAERAEFNDRVKVLRKQDRPAAAGEPAAAQYDQLDCEQLLLQFARVKKAGDPATADARQPTANLTIVEARAKGKVVELASDGDGQVKNLHATGVELHFDKAKGTTLLRGGPNLFVEMNGYELRLQGHLLLAHDPSGQKPIHEARALGAGEIRLFPPAENGGPSRSPILVKWRDQLTWGPDDGRERLLFQGPCTFEDPIRGKLEAQEQLAVWIDSVEPAENAGKGTPLARKQPSRLVATGEVKLTARELLIRRTDRLSLAFLPEATPPANAAQAGGAVAPVGSPLLEAGPAPPAKPPIEVTAGWIDGRLRKIAGRYELDRLRAEGNVLVFQNPVLPGDKPLDLRADRLDLSRLEENLHKVDVFGKPAAILIDKLFLSGPEIKLDQQQNTIEVVRAGTMRLPTRSDFEGRTLAQETDLTLEWTTQMLFDGSVATFVGNVRAEQQQARLTAGKLNVELDQKLSLKRRPEGAAKDKPIALLRLIGGNGVILERRGEKVGEYQRVQGDQLDFNNQRKVLLVNGKSDGGQGQFDLLSAQGDTLGLGGPAAPAGAPPRLKLTRIHFDRMEAEQASGVVTFRGGQNIVELYHAPTDNVDLELKPEQLPPGSLYIGCRRLMARAGKAGTGAQELLEFQCEERVRVEANEFNASADRLHYDVPKELLTLEALGGHQVTLHRFAAKGARGDRVHSQKLIYDRRTGQIKNIGINQINIGGPGR